MRHSPHPAIVLVLATVAALPAIAQNQSPTSSPFADEKVDSYADSNDPVTNEKRNIRWGDLKPNDFGPRAIRFTDEGLRKLRPVPAPGIHPRILFTPGDLPEMRHRMKQSRAGQIMYNHLLAYSAALRGRYDENAAYAKPDLWKGNYRGSHGNVQLWYYHDEDSPFNPANRVFEHLIAGDQTVDPKVLWPVFDLDALRCLIDDDKTGAQQLAKAVDTAMLHDVAARNADRTAKKIDKPLSAPISGGAGGQDFGYLYDILYNYLTPNQKTTWHDELASSTWSHDNYGTFTAAVSTRSNWATFTYWLIPLLAIEGEPGYNELKADGIYRGYRIRDNYCRLGTQSHPSVEHSGFALLICHPWVCPPAWSTVRRASQVESGVFPKGTSGRHREPKIECEVDRGSPRHLRAC